MTLALVLTADSIMLY